MCQKVVTKNILLFALFSCAAWSSCSAMDLDALTDAGSRENSPERCARVRDRSLEPRENAEISREVSQEIKNLAACVAYLFSNQDENRESALAVTTAEQECAKKEMSEKGVLADSSENIEQESAPTAVELQPSREKQKLSIDTTSGRRTPCYSSGCGGCLWNDPCFRTPTNRTSPYRVSSPIKGSLQSLPFDWCP